TAKCPLLTQSGHHRSSEDDRILIALSQAALVTFKTPSCRPQALCLFVKGVNFIIEPRHLGFGRLGAAQLLERLTDGELSCFGHDNRSCHCMDIVIPLRLREASRPIAGPRTLITTPLVFCSVATLPPPTIASAADPCV